MISDFGGEAKNGGILRGHSSRGAVSIEMCADNQFLELGHLVEELDVVAAHHAGMLFDAFGHRHVDSSDVGSVEVPNERDEFRPERFGLLAQKGEYLVAVEDLNGFMRDLTAGEEDVEAVWRGV